MSAKLIARIRAGEFSRKELENLYTNASRKGHEDIQLAAKEQLKQIDSRSYSKRFVKPIRDKVHLIVEQIAAENGWGNWPDNRVELADALIRDIKWDWPTQFDDILNWSGGPRRSPVVILIDEAIEHGKHPYYDWEEKRGVWYGRLKKEHELDYPPEYREFLLEGDAFMRGEG